MPRYRVTLRRRSVEIIEAANPYQAAIIASERSGGEVEIESVTPAVGRPPASNSARNATKSSAAKTTKKVAKKREPMSAENRAKLAQNLVKARAARAAKAKAAKKSTRKSPAKKAARVVKKR
jgi:hypothetical protein